jgi:hypothetical protein
MSHAWERSSQTCDSWHLISSLTYRDHDSGPRLVCTMVTSNVLSRLLLVWSATVLQAFALTPPNPPPSHDQRTKYRSNRLLSAFSWAGSVLAPKLFKGFLYLLALNETRHLESQELKRFPALTLVGCLFVISGSLLRFHCYRMLGRFFTFQRAPASFFSFLSLKLYHSCPPT